MFMVKTTQKSDLPWSAIFSVIVFQGQGLLFDMKCHILRDFRISTPFKEKSSHHFKHLRKLELLTNVDVNLRSFLGEAMNIKR